MLVVLLILRMMGNRLLPKVQGPVQGDVAQEAVHVLLPEVLHQVPVRPGRSLREQTNMPLLQQLEDSRWQT